MVAMVGMGRLELMSLSREKGKKGKEKGGCYWLWVVSLL